MKKLVLFAAIAAMGAASAYFLPEGDSDRPRVENIAAESGGAGDPPKKFSKAEAEKGAALAKQVATADIDLPRLPALSKSELEAKIAEIDDHIRGEHYVERSNRGQLSASELLAFRRLLAMRNQYFEQKIDILLNET